MKAFMSLLFVLCVPAWAATTERADPASDAPEARIVARQAVETPASYAEALQRWQSVDDINAWIGARFEYDTARAVRLSETQRQQGERITIHTAEQFFLRPTGVCVDLARFVVETMRVIDPGSTPKYLMIEFDPVQLNGNTLRRHWVAAYQRGGKLYVTGDSKRPGHVAGPYADVQTFIAEYARYRRRAIVAFSERETYRRTMRTLAVRRERSERTAEASSGTDPGD
jgi:hypothetical protein